MEVRQEAMRAIKERNPNAFEDKIEKKNIHTDIDGI